MSHYRSLVLIFWCAVALIAAPSAMAEKIQKIPVKPLWDEVIVYSSDSKDEVATRVSAKNFPDYIYMSRKSEANGFYRIYSPDGSIAGWVDPMKFNIDKSGIITTDCETALADANQRDAKGIAGACPDR